MPINSTHMIMIMVLMKAASKKIQAGLIACVAFD